MANACRTRGRAFDDATDYHFTRALEFGKRAGTTDGIRQLFSEMHWPIPSVRLHAADSLEWAIPRVLDQGSELAGFFYQLSGEVDRAISIYTAALEATKHVPLAGWLMRRYGI